MFSLLSVKPEHNLTHNWNSKHTNKFIFLIVPSALMQIFHEKDTLVDCSAKEIQVTSL